jgi:hypothetical protein
MRTGREGFSALFPGGRSDRGTSRAIRPDLAELIVKATREKPRRSLRRIIRALERARIVRPGELSRSSVHLLLAAHGISTRPLRGSSAERRSFPHEHAGDLWMAMRYYVDLGSAYIADSLKLICAELGIRLLHVGAGSDLPETSEREDDGQP